jgi:hypothetical protein
MDAQSLQVVGLRRIGPINLSKGPRWELHVRRNRITVVWSRRGLCSFLLVLSVLAGGCSRVQNEGRRDDGSSSSSVGLSQVRSPQAGCPDSADWCQIALEAVPSQLRRPLDLPEVPSASACPADDGYPYDNDQFGGFALGRPPLQPLIGLNRPRDATAIRQGVLRFRSNPEEPGWYQIKTLWFAWPSYLGPALIRGRQLDGANPILFGESPTLTDPFLSAGPTANGGDGFRQWPGGTWIRAPGCYAWQIDGLDFTYMIVFKAEFES